MKKTKKGNRLLRLGRLIYCRLFLRHDTPGRIAFGLGLGVFTGIMPGMGPIAALFLAFLFRVNRAAAFLGSLLTNTWLSFFTFLLSIKVGSVIMGLDWSQVYNQCRDFLKNFKWLNLFQVSILKIILPLVLGYLVIGFCSGLVVYVIALVIIKRIRHAPKSRT